MIGMGQIGRIPQAGETVPSRWSPLFTDLALAERFIRQQVEPTQTEEAERSRRPGKQLMDPEAKSPPDRRLEPPWGQRQDR